MSKVKVTMSFELEVDGGYLRAGLHGCDDEKVCRMQAASTACNLFNPWSTPTVISVENHPEMSGALNRESPFNLNGDYSSHPFGKEETVEDIVRRIAWESEMEGMVRRNKPVGWEAIAESHARARKAYTKLLSHNLESLFR